MKKVKVSFDTWIQLLGMIGVLGGLVFVGLEMQQSQRIAIAGQLQARNDAIMNYWSAPLDGNETALYVLAQNIGDDFIITNEEERAVWSLITRIRILSLNNAWRQYGLGLIPLDTFEGTRSSMLGLDSTCRARPLVVRAVPEEFLQYLQANSAVDCGE